MLTANHQLMRVSRAMPALRACRGASAGLHTLVEEEGRRAREDRKRRSTALRKNRNITGLEVASHPFHMTVRKDSTLIIVGTGAVAIAVVASKTMDFIAGKAFGSGKGGDKAEPETVDEPVTAAKDTADTTASTSTSSSNERDSPFDAVDPAVAAARKKAAAAKEAAKQAEQAKTKAQEPAKDKDGNPVPPVSYLDEVMGEVYALWGGDWKAAKANFFAKNFYDGGFEDKMTRREAALILGVRENTAQQRIKESHRRILLLNHPDRGGSPYVAAKINLAKDLLIKGK